MHQRFEEAVGHVLGVCKNCGQKNEDWAKMISARAEELFAKYMNGEMSDEQLDKYSHIMENVFVQA